MAVWRRDRSERSAGPANRPRAGPVPLDQALQRLFRDGVMVPCRGDFAAGRGDRNTSPPWRLSNYGRKGL